MAAAYHSSSKLAAAAGNQSDDPLGINQKEGRVAGAFDDQRHEGDTYYATPSYPDTTPDQAKPAAASSSSSAGGHPQGPADVSSMNDPSGKGQEPEGNEHVHYPGRPDAQPGSSSSNASADSFKAHSSPRSSVETFPGTTFEEGMIQPSGLKGSRGFSSSSSSVVRTFETLTRKFKMSLFADSSSSSMMSHFKEACCGNGIAAAVRKFATDSQQQGVSQGSFAGEGVGGESSPSSEIPVPDHSWSNNSDSNKDPKSAEAVLNSVEGGTGSPISGSWRAMTADFAAGGDDMTGGGSAGTVADDMGMKINADSGLPQLNDVSDAGAHSAGFGAQRDPQAAADEGYTARQTEKSTGQIPADAGSS